MRDALFGCQGLVWHPGQGQHLVLTPKHPWVLIAWGKSTKPTAPSLQHPLVVHSRGETFPSFPHQSQEQPGPKVTLQPGMCQAGVTVRKNKHMLEVNALIILMIGFALDCSAEETLFYQSQLKACSSPKAQQ